MQPFFITASGTGIGKTLVTTSLCWQARQSGKKVTAIKPVISGFDASDQNSDTSLILQSSGIEPSLPQIETISPWRFAAPLSPDMAAAREGHAVDTEQLVAFCRKHMKTDSDYLFAEGVGGVMSPINDHHTVLDWIGMLGWPVLLAGGSYLGAITHTLSAFEVLQARKTDVRAIIISESELSQVPLADTVRTIEKFVPPIIPVIHIPRITTRNALWTQVPPLDKILKKSSILMP